MARRRGIRGRGKSRKRVNPETIKIADISCGFGWNFMALDSLAVDYSIEYIYHDDKQMLSMFKEKYGKKRIVDFSKSTKNLPKVDIMFYSFDGNSIKDEYIYNRNMELIKQEMPPILVMEEYGTKKIGNSDSKSVIHITEELSDMGYNNSIFVSSGSEIGFPNDTPRLYIISSLNNNYVHDKDYNEINLLDLTDEVDVSDYLIDMFQRKNIKRDNSEFIYGHVDDGKLYPVPIYYNDKKIPRIETTNLSKTSTIIFDKRINVIRRLTNRELFMLMGYDEDTYNKYIKHGTIHKIPRIINKLSILPVKRNVIKNVLKMIDK